MKKLTTIILVLISTLLPAQVEFNKYFHNKQLRLDYFHTGNSDTDSYSFDELIEEPYWGGSKNNLIDTIGYGNFMFFVYDLKSNTLIYSRGYSSLFQEWQTTDEAKKIVRTFSETLVFPYPKDSVRVEIHDRDRKNNFVNKQELVIDPNSYFVKKEKLNPSEKFKVHYSGSSSIKLDIVFIPEGYSENEKEKFHQDCQRVTEYLFEYAPFSELKNSFNIWGVNAYSKDSGVDIPGDSIWKSTIVNSSFYTFDSERYLMTTDMKSVRNYASNAPYDQIYILANTEKYGGGAIYNYYSITAVDHPSAKQVFVHEFGHGLAGLADEYGADATYNEFYPLDVEPWEPNITTLINFESKWKYLLPADSEIPSSVDGKDQLDIGVYEGAGYVSKGVYRSTPNSLMRAFDSNEFNEVSKAAIEKIIRFYTE
jgi:hypothetical protein